MKSNLKIVISIMMILPILAMPAAMLPDAHAMQSATWSHNRIFMQTPKLTGSLSYYNHVSPADCTHYATTSTKCSGTDTIYDTFSYTTPESYSTAGSCSYLCESQDVYVNYPPTFTHNGITYHFSTAQQDQCATNFGCSTETRSTTGPVVVAYSGTPVGIPVTIDTQVFYEDSSNTHEVEIEFTYNLDYGYHYG